jgi:hypothetical protein
MTEANPDYPNVLAIREFNKQFAANGAMFTSFVTIGDGMLMGVVKK